MTRKISDYDPSTVVTNTQKNSSGKKATTLIAANILADQNFVWAFNGRVPKTAEVSKIKPLHWKSQTRFKSLHHLSAAASCFDVAWKSKHAGNKEQQEPTVAGVHNLVKDIVSATSSKKSTFFLSSSEAFSALNFFIRLCKISPEIFEKLWSSRGKITCTPITTIWAGAHRAF